MTGTEEAEHLNRLLAGYQGDRLIAALREQALVSHDAVLVERLMEKVHVAAYPANSYVYQDGDIVRGLWFLLHGRIEIRDEGNMLGSIPPGRHFGEFPLLCADPTYDVDALAAQDSIVLRLAESDFVSIANDFPQVWKRLAKTLADRLKGANKKLRRQNPIPRVFLGSSTEALPVVRALEREYDHDSGFQLQRWTEEFRIADYAAESLGALSDYDFAIFVLSADDEVQCRGKKSRSPRDNILFEAGMGFGQLGRKRTFLIQERGVSMKVPSDLTGINIDTYKQVDDKPDVKVAAARIRDAILELGPRTRLELT